MAEADYRLATDATLQELVAALQRVAPLQMEPYIATITPGQWSGSGTRWYIAVSNANVTANSITRPYWDNASEQYLTGGKLWCEPYAGGFYICTPAKPTGNITVFVEFPGTVGEAQYQVLADVYSTSQVDSKIAQSTADVAMPPNVAETLDLNDIKKNSIVNYTAGSTNIPVSGHSGSVMTMASNWGSQQLQVAMASNTRGYYARTCNADTWDAWHQQSTANYDLGPQATLPNLTGNGLKGFVLTQNASIDSYYIPAGARIFGYMYSGIFHGACVYIGASFTTLRYQEGVGWSVLQRLGS